MSEAELSERFLREILRNPCNAAILDAWDRLALKDGWLVAGCLFQTVWNLQAGRDPGFGIKDYDIFYFDDAEVSAEAEAIVQRRVDEALAPLAIEVEAKNQARVHLWYEDWFGFPYAPLRSSRDGIERFLVPATCVGVRPDGHGALELYAPYGLALMYDGLLTPNPLVDHRPLFEKKAQSYRERWPWLRVEL